MHLWEKVNEEHGQYICSEYLSDSVLIVDISRELNVSGYIVQKVLVHNEVTLKTDSEVKKESNSRSHLKQRRYSLNFDYFKTWSHNMAYYLGFIYADGCIKNTLLRIGLQIRDKEFLKEFKNEIGFGGYVREGIVKGKNKEYGYAALSIKSLDMISDLRRIGLYEDKSLTIDLPEIPKEYEIDFVRGFFDGDGCVSVKRQIHKTRNSDTYQIISSFCSGSLDMMNGIQGILSRHGLKKKLPKQYGGRTPYEMVYSTTESYKMYELFYGQEDIKFLQRKKDVFERGFKLRE